MDGPFYISDQLIHLSQLSQIFFNFKKFFEQLFTRNLLPHITPFFYQVDFVDGKREKF